MRRCVLIRRYCYSTSTGMRKCMHGTVPHLTKSGLRCSSPYIQVLRQECVVQHEHASQRSACCAGFSLHAAPAAIHISHSLTHELLSLTRALHNRPNQEGGGNESIAKTQCGCSSGSVTGTSTDIGSSGSGGGSSGSGSGCSCSGGTAKVKTILKTIQ